MKNKFIIGALVGVFLLCSPNIKAESFPDNQTVDPNKTWTIKFNYEIELDDLTKQGITVVDRKGDLTSVGVKLGQDGKSIIVTAPEGGYKAGENYMLNIESGLHSSNGNALKHGYSRYFNIKRKPSSGGIVTFKDENLEQKIRDHINKASGDIYKSDVEEITELEVQHSEIQDISGIENLTNLKQLTLGNNKISDINVLKNLTNLQTLNLIDNQLKDISALKNLVNLQSIDLRYNEISNISALKNLTNLKQLDLDNNKISDISALRNLTNLQELSFGCVPCGAIDAPVLKENYNEISDVSALKNLTNLEGLNLRHNKVKDISTLKGLSNLQTIDLSYNQINDISGIANTVKGLSNLNSIDLANNQISNISELKELTNLRMLDLSDNKISDVSVFKNLLNLKWLALFDNPVSKDDIQALKNALPGCEINELLIKKPNIYLYPEKTEELSVNVTPEGKITKSIPEYNGVWKVKVDPSGKIDNTYDFLFYEASLDYQFTLDKGWIVNKGSFNEEMNNILTSIGLNFKEKADFIEYWSKELNWKSSRYAAYYLDPKEINEAIKLNISKEPDSILRAYFYFVPLKDNENLEIKKPEIKEFRRNGFTVVEWGGIGK